MSADQRLFKTLEKGTPSWREVHTISKPIVLDSRQRNCVKYPNPSDYTIQLGDTYKNISALELKGAIVPKSNYNVHSSNNKIDFAIGDYVSGFNIINGGAGYTSAPAVIIGPPEPGGTNAVAHSIIDNRGTISNIVIDINGSGYLPSKPPFVMIGQPSNQRQAVQPKITAVIGYRYTATLRVGEYEVGGNPIPPAVMPTGLLLEIQNSMNYAVNGGNYNPLSTSPFCVRLVSQYPQLGAIAGTPEAFDTNACLFNRIQVINTDSHVWEFLWCSGVNRLINASSILGFNTVDSGPGILTTSVVNGAGTLIPAGTAIRGSFDFNLNNDPDYVVVSININENKMDRMKSLDESINDRFAVLLFDNNNPDTLHDMSFGTGGSIDVINSVRYLNGQSGKGAFWRAATSTKPVKGSDYDIKKLSFKPPIGKVSSISIKFTKFGYKPGEAPSLYNMEGREHLLVFEITASENMSQIKDHRQV